MVSVFCGHLYNPGAIKVGNLVNGYLSLKNSSKILAGFGIPVVVVFYIDSFCTLP